MSAVADLVSAFRTAHAQGHLSAAALGQASGWVQSGALPAADLASLSDLVARAAWAELEDRFYKGIAFGTGGMRGRTIGRVSAPAEVAADGTPLRAAVGSACLNDINVLRAALEIGRAHV